MVALITPDDPMYFTESSSAPYDRHHYRVVYSNDQSVDVASWEEARALWFEAPPQFLKCVEVLDIPLKKVKTGKGFK